MSKTKILIVEDESIIALHIQDMLKSKGFEVLVASTGQEAIAKTEELKPELVIMDIVLQSKIDGIS